MSWLANVWSRIRNERGLVMPPPQYRVRSLPVFEAGVTLSVDEAMRVSVVWACMDALVKSLAPRPWHVYELAGEKRSLRRDDPLSYLLNTRPNPQMTAIAMREALQYSAIGWGNGYAEIVRNGKGVPAELWPLEPDRVVPWRNEETGDVGYRVYAFSGGSTWVPGDRIFHLRGPATVNGVAGDNLLVRASRGIAIAASAQQYSASFLANGGMLSGVIEGEAKIPDSRVVDNLRAQWVERYGGPQNSGNPMILHGGFKWREIQSDPNKAQLLETRKFQVEEIARYFGVPLQMLQVTAGSHGYGTNIEQLGIAFVRDTIRPWAERFEQEADFKLISGRIPYRETKIDLSDLLRGTEQEMALADEIRIRSGVRTINECRESDGKNHIGAEGDVHFLPGTYKTTDQIINPPAPVAAPAPAPAAAEGDAMMNAVHRAVSIVFAGALDRYGRALKNRKADLERSAPEKREANLAQAREQFRARLVEDCAEAMALLGGSADLGPFAEAVEQGEPPRLSADRLVDRVLNPPAATPVDGARELVGQIGPKLDAIVAALEKPPPSPEVVFRRENGVLVSAELKTKN